eukprot:m.193651 g.193651  ORF g.193651 m.193651 type:complete len:193 (+) comp18296_c0_seq9:183-761(+)
MVFQSVNDTALDALVAASGSRLQRYPGGTPSGFWWWPSNWETYRHEVPLPRPTTQAMWQSYLRRTGQQSVYVPNIVGSYTNASFEVQGLLRHQAAGSNVTFVELGNEIYDHTVAAILQRYPNVTVYANAMLEWVSALRSSALSAPKIALCGGVDAAWNTALLSSPVAKQASPTDDKPSEPRQTLARSVLPRC